jgi:hypothetical protein
MIDYDRLQTLETCGCPQLGSIGFTRILLNGTKSLNIFAAFHTSQALAPNLLSKWLYAPNVIAHLKKLLE